MVLDTERALAEALASVLLTHAPVASATAACDAMTAAAAIESNAVDTLVVGTDSEAWDSLAFLRWAARRRPGLALVAMSADEDVGQVARTLLAGAISWVSKRARVEDMAEVVLVSTRGESSVPAAMLRQVLRLLAADAAPAASTSIFTGLTERESEILEYAALGLSRSDIAGEIGLSVNTVRTHIQHILGKLGVHTTLEAVTLLLREQNAADGEAIGPPRSGIPPGLDRNLRNHW
jgi:DNA-binding NarL/FixJ family response regulator